VSVTLSQSGLFLHRRVFIGLEFYQVYLPFLQLICFKPLVEVSVLSGSHTSLCPASFGLFACLDFGACPLFLFLSLSWVLSFYKVRQGFITCLLFSEGHLPCSKVSNLGAEYKPVSGGSFFYEEPLVPII
jgi:hypothetical protein